MHRTSGAMHVSIASSETLDGSLVLQGGWRSKRAPTSSPTILACRVIRSP